MGTIAQKLTYLNDTKQLLKENINNLGGNLTNEPFRQYASVLEGIYERLPKVSGIGASLSLSPSLMGKIKLNEIQGDTLQENTPTPDTPVPIQNVTGLQNVEVCGKNLINSVVKNGNRLFFNGGSDAGTSTFKAGTYTISYTSQNTITTYIKNTDGTQTNLGTNKTITFTSNKDFDLWLYRSGITIEEVSNIQLEQGSTATEYEPYKSNTYEVNLGKNLLDTSKMIKFTPELASRWYWIDGIYAADPSTLYYKVEQGKTYTISIKEKSNFTKIQGIYKINDVESQAFIIEGNNTTATFTPNTTTNLYVRGNTENSNVETYCICQLEKGSTSTSFSPYFTPIELNKIGTYKDSIKKSTGKNLFDKSTITTGKYIDASGNLVNDNSNFVGDYILIDNTKSYYASQNVGGVIRVGYYDSNKSFISRQLISANYGSLTIPNNAVYVRLSCYNQSLDILQLEIGTQQTSYEPYGKVWYEEKQIGKVVLDGSEGWGLASTYTNNTRFSSSSLILGKTTNLISNYFVEGQGGTDTTNIDTNGTTGALMITIPNNIASTLSQFTTWLSTNNTEVIYQLATPTYTEITNTELIEDLETLYTAKSQEGTTNISITSEDLEMILNVSALKGDA